MADENAVSSTTTSLPTANTRCKSEPPSVLRALLESDSDEEGVSKSEPCYSCQVSPESNHCSNISDPNSPVNCSVRQPAAGSPATPSPSPLNGPEQSQNDFPNTPTSDQENSPKEEPKSGELYICGSCHLGNVFYKKDPFVCFNCDNCYLFYVFSGC